MFASLRGRYIKASVMRKAPVIVQACLDAGFDEVILFGSVARGSARWDSDVDVAVAPVTASTRPRLRLLQLDLTGVVERSVDLTAIRYADAYLLVGLGQDGICLRCLEPTTRCRGPRCAELQDQAKRGLRFFSPRPFKGQRLRL